MLYDLNLKVRAVCRAMLDATRLLYTTPSKPTTSTQEPSDSESNNSTDSKFTKQVGVCISIDLLFLGILTKCLLKRFTLNIFFYFGSKVMLPLFTFAKALVPTKKSEVKVERTFSFGSFSHITK